MSIPDDLQQLSDLFERGLLTREQFDAAKGRLLGVDPGAGIPAEAPSSSTPQAAIQQSTDEASTVESASIVEAGDRTGTVSLPGPMRSTVSNRMKPVIAFVRENRTPTAVAGAVVLILLVAMLAQPSEPPRPTAATTPSPQAQLQNTINRCVTNLVSWIDEFERNYERVYRTFGVESQEAQAIAQLSNQYFSRSFQIGADRAAEEVYPQIVGACSNNSEFAERITRFTPN